jgi:hypothetical protein
LENVRLLWLDGGPRGIPSRYLILEDMETGDVLLPLYVIVVIVVVVVEVIVVVVVVLQSVNQSATQRLHPRTPPTGYTCDPSSRRTIRASSPPSSIAR